VNVAPEILTGGYDGYDGDNVYDKQVVMWSVGAMMYMLYWPRHTPSLEYRDLGVIRELTNRLAPTMST
jgi:hypothetical protein